MTHDVKVSDFVQVVRGVISKEHCAEIVEEFSQHEGFQWSLIQSGDGDPVVNYEHRMVRELLISDPEVWMYNSDRVRLNKIVKEGAQKAVSDYFTRVRELGLVDMTPQIIKDEGFKLLKYKEGYRFNEHFDDIPEYGRVLTCSIAMNDNFEGGKFTFFKGTHVEQLQAGDAILFPSNFMFPHAVTPIRSGERYSIITWLH